VFPILAEWMREVAFFCVGAKIHARSDIILQPAHVGESFGSGSSFLDMKEAHHKALVRVFLSRFFWPCCSLLFNLHLPTLPLFKVVGWVAPGFFVSLLFGACVKPPPVDSMNKLFAKMGLSFGIELLSMCS
jgi:hypothetical protein